MRICNGDGVQESLGDAGFSCCKKPLHGPQKPRPSSTVQVSCLPRRSLGPHFEHSFPWRLRQEQAQLGLGQAPGHLWEAQSPWPSLEIRLGLGSAHPYCQVATRRSAQQWGPSVCHTRTPTDQAHSCRRGYCSLGSKALVCPETSTHPAA